MNRLLDLNAPVTAEGSSLSVEEPMISVDDTKLQKPKTGFRAAIVSRCRDLKLKFRKKSSSKPNHTKNSHQDRTGIQSPPSTSLVLEAGNQKALHCTDSEGLKTLAVDDPRQHIDAVSETTQPITSVVTPNDHVVVMQIKMAIHRHGKTFIRIGKLDTAAEANIISQQVVEDLGLQPEAYKGEESLSSIGGSVQPLGVLNLDWNVMGKSKTYTDEFYVISKEQSKAFDILISEETIKSIGFFKKDVEVWCLGLEE
ncbi:MAG: hypothetical protein Q9214_000412 [Letrouitia sp. 1 TL-2023]